jgi:hypothetical protein
MKRAAIELGRHYERLPEGFKDKSLIINRYQSPSTMAARRGTRSAGNT